MVGDRRMPRAKVIDARRVWDSHKLDLAFEAPPTAVRRLTTHGGLKRGALKIDLPLRHS